MIFFNNTARQGGALYFNRNSHKVMFQGNTNVTFVDNRATQGGAVYFLKTVFISDITFTGNAVLTFVTIQLPRVEVPFHCLIIVISGLLDDPQYILTAT